MGCGNSKAVGASTTDNIKSALKMESKGDSRSRCIAMLREAGDLQARLVKANRDLRAMSKSSEIALDTSNLVLCTALPRVYEDSAAVDHAMTQQHDPVGGKGFSADALTKIRGDLQVKMQGEAFGPLDAWLAKYSDCVAKQKHVNRAWDNMITARKKAADAKEHADTLATRKLAQDPKLLESQRKLQQLQDAYLIASNKHEEEEAAQYTRLVALNTEAANMVTVIRQAMGQNGAALIYAYEAIPETPVVIQPISGVPKATSDAAAAAAQAAQAAAAAAAAAQAAAAAAPQAVPLAIKPNATPKVPPSPIIAPPVTHNMPSTPQSVQYGVKAA